MNAPAIAPHDLQTRRVLGRLVLVDVRDPEEYRSGHIPGSLSLPLAYLNPVGLAAMTGDERLGRIEPLYVVCKTGYRSEQAVRKLAADGLENVIMIEGGTDRWQSDGLPIRRCAPALNLQRQVQLALGLILVMAIALGALAHPGFYALAGMLGLGLISAGLTNWCGLARLMARMPWNHARGCTQSAAA